MLPTLSELELPTQSCDLWVVDLAEISAVADELQKLLNRDELEHLARFSNLAAQNAFLGSRGCLRFLLANYLGVKDLVIVSGAHGKPALQDYPDFHFNISHSHQRLVLLFAPCECGVDIECSSRRVEYQPIMKRFFQTPEIESWQKQPEPRQAFFRGWTRKEAYLKATGEGIGGLGKVQISFAPGLSRPIIFAQDDPKGLHNWFFSDFNLPPDYLGSIALRGSPLPCHTRNLF